MVRLGVNLSHENKLSCNSFNSTMVRLGVLPNSGYGFTDPVSIPPWYDWELYDTIKTYFSSMFQFHHGTIGSDEAFFLENFSFSFNSTMVRLGVQPLFSNLLRILQFQFHHGTIGSRALAQKNTLTFSELLITNVRFS